ncbi:hypothetical protein [Cohnella nanjingensis]|uniref:6-bladed beta-propeller n=1 Tax=Cohnella nanjingensis TaxID=1387779 RepID=A0A7X0VHK7_9BACL|nr:hypothetical protein [Cohnella nanjingensis]MBB6672759.1 hypothetical protein [Cohnella nanjingensis]
MGNETRSYEVVSNWAKLPEGRSFGYTHGIEVDANNRYYVFHTGSPAMYVFDEEGNFLNAWGEEFAGGAHGCYLHREADGERFYLTDTARSEVIKTDLEGNVLLRIGTPDLPDVYDAERLFVPTDVAVGPGGLIYVADGYGQSYIHVYDQEGHYIKSWGGKGNGEGQLDCPHGVSVDYRHDEPEIYVADRGNNRIQVFTLEGRHKRFVTEEMRMPDSFFYYGDEVVFPDLLSRVTVLDKDDKLIVHLGDDPEASKQEGWPNLPNDYYRADRFSSPHGVCADAAGNLYVAEWTQDGRVTKLVRG